MQIANDRLFMKFYNLENIIYRNSISYFDIMIKNLYNGFIRIHILYHAIDEKICHNETVSGKRRIYYRATSQGEKILEQAREKIKELYDEVILNG